MTAIESTLIVRIYPCKDTETGCHKDYWNNDLFFKQSDSSEDLYGNKIKHLIS